MSILMVKTPDGQLRRAELSKNQPLTIGAHSVSDIQIEEPGVELMEARISWGKERFEVTAANPNGVTVNGESVQSAGLNPGDVITLGNTQLVFTTEELLEQSLAGLTDSDAQDSESEEDIGLVPITDEVASYLDDLEDSDDDADPTYQVQPSAKRKRESSMREPGTLPEDFGDSVGEESREDDDRVAAGTPMLKRGKYASDGTTVEEEEEAPPPPDVSAVERIRESLHASRQRPGEKEIMRSPLVLGLSIGSIFLLVGAVVLWSMIGREEADRYLARAREQAEQRLFQQAIDDYNTYMLEFPGDADIELASRELSITKVRSQIDVGVPDWKEGLRELEELVDRHRDDKDFSQLHEKISQFAEQIAKGACEQAGRQGDPALFEISDAALRLVELYATDEDSREEILAEVKAVRRTAEARILKQDVFETAFAQMESALKQSKPFQLLDARLELIRRYASAETDSRVTEFLQKALDLEQSLIQQHRDETEAPELPAALGSPVVTLSERPPVSPRELPSHRPVYVHAGDCVYGVDTATGEPIWRHVTGWVMPFFPIEVSLGEPALLLYADRDRELQLLSRETGQMIWRQSLPDRVVGTPLIDGTQAFLSTEAGMLQQIDLSTGTVLSSLSFSQPLATGPLLLPEKKHGVLIGERELAYLIELNPPAIVDVLYFGHGPGSVATDPIRMGPLVLLAENDRSNSARLRVFDTRQEAPDLVQTDEKRISGRVIDEPVIRGKQLLVPSTPERVTAFTVSAEHEQSPLTEINQFQVPNPRLTSTWISAGPDGQVWMASSAVRRMHLTTESFEASSDVAAVGIATQPIQMLGDRMYVARRPDFGRAVRFSRLDRNNFAGAWRTTLGDRILHSTLNSSGELITLHDSGAVFRLQSDELADRPFVLSANAHVEIPDLIGADRFSARFSDGRFAMAWGGAEPKLSVVRTTGQIEREYELPEAPQTAPVDFDAGIIVALPGRLHMVTSSRRGKVEDFLLPVVEGQPIRWNSLTRIDGTHLLSLEEPGVLRRIEYRTEPLTHLAEAGKLELESNAAIPPVVTSPDRVVIATEEKQLLSVAADSLQILASQSLDAVPTAAWKSGSSVFMQLQNDTLVCLSDDDKLTERWRVKLKKQSVAGRPLEQNETWVVPVAPEGVWILKKESGEVVRKVKTPGTCSGDPLLIDGQAVIPLADGSLFFLPEPAEGGDQL